MTQERPEDDRAAGVLRLTLGGTPVELPVLRIRQSRLWREQLRATDIEDGEDVERPIQVMLDLVAAYDVTGLLGGRDAIEDRATDAEVYAAFQQMLAASFPFVETPPLTEAFGRLVVAAFYRRAKPTNGRLPTGASAPTRSRTR